MSWQLYKCYLTLKRDVCYSGMVEYIDTLHVSFQKQRFRSESTAKEGEKTMRDLNETGVLNVVALLLLLRHVFL